jgi:glycerol kinase
MAKNTYGTGCFMLLNTGNQAVTSQHGLITTAACQLDAAASAQYALEGSVFIGGAVVQWLRDGLQIIQHAGQVETLAASVPDAAGVVFVPAFTGLGAPYWDAEAKGAILGLSRGTTAAHIARAAVEAIAYQSAALLLAMQADLQHSTSEPSKLKELRVDGGAAMNNLLLQFQADLLGIPVIRPKITETTALGAAYLAGLAVGVYQNQDECTAQWQEERRFLPSISRALAQQLMQDWERAVQRVRN